MVNADPFEKYAFIGIGSNLPSAAGDSRLNVLRAVERLEELSLAPLLISSLIETAPVDCPPGSPDFVNAVVGLLPLSGETPLGLLGKLQRIEREMGRTRSGLINEARVIDLDLITFRREVCRTPDLTLPHPRATQRDFVMRPLGELVGDAIFPAQL